MTSVTPITTSTTLSINKTAALLQNLVRLAEVQDNENLPAFVQERVDELVNAHKKFVLDIDTYMHLDEREENETNAVTTIIKTCPEFLSTKDAAGALPIHRFAGSSAFTSLAEVGRRYGVGGEDGRGGLLITNGEGRNALQLLTEKQSTAVAKNLWNANPPLLLKTDIREHCLLHKAVKDQNIGMVKYMIKLDSSCLYQYDNNNFTPLAYACAYTNEENEDNKENEEKVNNENEEKIMDEEKERRCLEIVRCLLQQSVSHDPYHPSIGGLFSKTSTGELVFHRLIERYGEKNTWTCIERALAPYEDIPILHQIIRHAPEYCSLVLNVFPDSVLVCDWDNRFPVHVALESGIKWSLELLAIVNANRSHLKLSDPKTGYPLFMLAGMGTSCDVRTTYFLLRKNPEHAEQIICIPESEERVCENCPSSENVEIVCDDDSGPLQSISDGNTIFIKSKIHAEEAPIAKAQAKDTPIAKKQTGKASIEKEQETEAPIAKTQAKETPIAKIQAKDTPIAKTQTGKASIEKEQETEAPIAKTQAKETPIAKAQTVEASIANTRAVEAPIAKAQAKAYDDTTTFCKDVFEVA